MGTKKSELGNRYGRLTVIDVASDKNGHATWKCLCDCGKVTEVTQSNLRRGNSKSCGCLGREKVTAANTTHGHTVMYSRSATYKAWQSMLQRANNRPGYVHVSVCERWSKFENFLEDMGEVPKGMTLDRFPDQKGNYSPDNCRWATQKQQQNNRTNNKMITYKGETRTRAEWCDRLNLNYFMVAARLRLGWTVEKTLGTQKLGPTLANLTSFRGSTTNT